MKSSCFMSLASCLALTGFLAMSLAGCGTTTPLLTQGNWALLATSTQSAGTFSVGGNLSQNGETLSGTMYVTGACVDPSQAVPLTGTIKGSNVTLSGSVGGSLITVTAKANGSSAMSGTYTVTGGCADGDQGNVAANAVPSISGTWSGPISGSGGSNVTLSIALTQATTASANGTFALTGTVTYMNSTCSTSGTITSGSVAGTFIQELDVQTVESDASQGSFAYSGVNLNSATAPTSLTGDYSVDSGLCSSDAQTLTLTKQ